MDIEYHSHGIKEHGSREPRQASSQLTLSCSCVRGEGRDARTSLRPPRALLVRSVVGGSGRGIVGAYDPQDATSADISRVDNGGGPVVPLAIAEKGILRLMATSGVQECKPGCKDDRMDASMFARHSSGRCLSQQNVEMEEWVHCARGQTNNKLAPRALH